MKRNFYILGRNKRELFISIAVLLLGFIVVIVAMPPRAYESHTPRFYYENYGAARFALLFVFAVISWFCSLNALRDKSASEKEHRRIIVWAYVLGIWTTILFALLINWWQHLNNF